MKTTIEKIEVHNVQVTETRAQTVTFTRMPDRIEIVSPGLDVLQVTELGIIRNLSSEESDWDASTPAEAFALGAKKWWTDARYGAVYDDFGVRTN